MFNYDVVVCTYNGQDYVVEQLASIVNQSIPPQRIIISDDGSTDDTLLLIAHFSETTSVKIDIHHRRVGPIGPAHNFLYALTLTKSPYVFLSDQDDIWVENKVDYYFEVVEKQAGNAIPLLVFSDAELVDRELKPLQTSFIKNERLKPARQTMFKNMMFQNCIQGATMMVNRSLLDKVKPSNHMLMHDWWLGMIAAAFGQLVFIPEVLIRYRQHGNNVIGSNGYCAKRILFKLMRLPTVARQNRKVIKQASAFYKIYSNDLSKYDKKLLMMMLKSRHLGLWQFFLLRYSISRTTLIRTISLYFLY